VQDEQVLRGPRKLGISGRMQVKVRGLVLATAFLGAVSCFAQDIAVVTVKPLTDDDIKLIRQDVQSAKEGIIKDTMQFTDAEGTAFWPVYKLYAADQKAIADKRLAIIMDYAKKYDTLSNDDAKGLTQRMFQVDDDTQALRKKYFSKFETAIGAKRAAMFYQVDNRLTLIVNMQLASVIPLVQ
jgi:hypothetical protein